VLQGSNRCSARHRRKVVQEFVDRVAAFQIIEQIFERHPRSTEEGSVSAFIGG